MEEQPRFYDVSPIVGFFAVVSTDILCYRWNRKPWSSSPPIPENELEAFLSKLFPEPDLFHYSPFFPFWRARFLSGRPQSQLREIYLDAIQLFAANEGRVPESKIPVVVSIRDSLRDRVRAYAERAKKELDSICLFYNGGPFHCS